MRHLKLLRIIALLFTSLSIGACALPSDSSGEKIATQGSVKFLYGTNRGRDDITSPTKFYGRERGALEYGVASVAGVAGLSRTRLTAIEPLSREDYLARLRLEVQSASAQELLVYIHGYNRSFAQVSKRFAEFVAHTQFRGVAIAWSWPSGRQPVGYLQDESNIRWARADLTRFLQDHIENSSASSIHLLGHSMGGAALADVIYHRLLKNDIDSSNIGEVVFLAPDIDAAVFKRDVGPEFVTAGLSTTLYTSSNDRAMDSARTLRGYPRAGDSTEGPVLVPGIETIDVTAENKSFLGHSYFGKSEYVRQDLALLLNDRKRANERPNLVRVQNSNGNYWRLAVD